MDQQLGQMRDSRQFDRDYFGHAEVRRHVQSLLALKVPVDTDTAFQRLVQRLDKASSTTYKEQA